jgi:hypothetical protein
MNETVFRLEQWSVQAPPFSAPELGRAYLCGVCPERAIEINPNHDPMREIVTSRIVKSEGRRVTTKSGRVYELGSPSPAYVEAMREIGRTIDEDNPVKVIHR